MKFPVLIQPGYSFMRSQPKTVPAIAGQMNDIVVGYFRLRLFLKSCNRVSIIYVQPVDSANPQKAVFVDSHRLHIVLRKTVGRIEVGKGNRLGARFNPYQKTKNREQAVL